MAVAYIHSFSFAATILLLWLIELFFFNKYNRKEKDYEKI